MHKKSPQPKQEKKQPAEVDKASLCKTSCQVVVSLVGSDSDQYLIRFLAVVVVAYVIGSYLFVSLDNIHLCIRCVDTL